MSFVRVIVILGIVLYNTQNNTIFATIGPNEAFSHFIQHKNHVLDVEKISSFLVSIVTECALRCVRHVSCLSFNIKEDTTENSTQMTCELLPMDLYNASLKFHESEEFHHWSFISPCLHLIPCKNGGTCISDNTRGQYVCLCPTGYQGTNCQLLQTAPALGKDKSKPGLSCKDIVDRQDYSQGDGEYWIAPDGSNNSFIVYCDMTTDGGGWTLLKRFTIPADLSGFWTEIAVLDENYTSISNYTANFLFVSKKAVQELREAVDIKQLRWYCYKKQQGSIFHVMTKNNSAGYSALDYFLLSPDVRATACDSFIRLPDDNSTLSQSCTKWGHNGTNAEVNEWGYYSHTGHWRLYREVSRWIAGQKSFSLRPQTQYWCDDEGGSSTVSPGDTWEVYAR